MSGLGDTIVYGPVSTTGVRTIGGKARDDGTVSKVISIAYAEIITSRGLVSCEMWDATVYEGPKEGEIGFFRVVRPGRMFNGVQSHGGVFVQAPDLKALEMVGQKAHANGNGHR
jgi:hypothetical protein